MTTINERVNQVRRQHGLTQQKFAEMLGISRTHIANVENRQVNPSVPVLKLIAAKFSVNEHWLLTGEGSPAVPVTTVGQRIGELRREENLTQKALAQELGISLSSVINYENNQRFPVSGVLSLFQRYFNVSREYLIGESDDRSPAVPAVPAQSGKEQTAAQLMAKIGEFRAMSAAIEKEAGEIKELLGILTA